MFKDIVVQMNGIEKNPLTLFMLVVPSAHAHLLASLKFNVHCIILRRFLGAAVGTGKSPIFKQCARGYKSMRRTWDLKINLKPLRGSMANLVKMMIDYDSNIMLYTTEGKLELLMAASSSQDKKNNSHTAYDVACTLFNDGEGAKEELSSSGVSFSRQLVVIKSPPPPHPPTLHSSMPHNNACSLVHFIVILCTRLY